MPVLLIGDLYAELLDAADTAGATRVNARASWVRENLAPGTWPESAIQPGRKIAKLRCAPPPCVELWTVDDDAIPADWEVVP